MCRILSTLRGSIRCNIPSSTRFKSESRRFGEIRNSSLISADQRKLDPLSHRIDAFGVDTNAVAEMPFHLFCLGAAAMAGARRATAAFLTGLGDHGVIAFAID